MRAGVDEAGRGPVLGPLVVAGVAGPPRAVPAGVDDSKRLSPGLRARLAREIRGSTALGSVALVIDADELNRRMRAGENLNRIELHAFCQVIERLGAASAVVDALGSRPERLGAELTRRLGVPVEARVGADRSDPLVSAASILAKVERDEAIVRIADELGADVGSGYPSDPRTRAFLRAWRAKHDEPPPHARTAWSTIEDLGFGRTTLDAFVAGGARGEL